MMNVCIRNQHEKVTHDKDGNITIVDRIKDMIKVRNFLTGWGIFFCAGERAAGLPDRVRRSVGQGSYYFS